MTDQPEPLPRQYDHVAYRVVEDAAGTRLEPGRQPRLGCGLAMLAIFAVLAWWFEQAWLGTLAPGVRAAIAIGAALAGTMLLVGGMAAADRAQAAMGPYLTTDLAQGAWTLPRRGATIPFAWLASVEWLVVRQPPGSGERMTSTHVQVNLRHRTAGGMARTNLITVEGHQEHAALRELAQGLARRAQLDALEEGDTTFADDASYQRWNKGRWRKQPADGGA
jgi:hypothetical protein